jgi:SAM-dependent methyltransferase
MKQKIFFNLAYFRKPGWDTNISPPELIDFLNSHPPGRAVDLGCGTGTNVITMARYGWRAEGLDFAWVAIMIARRKAKKAGVDARFFTDDIISPKHITGQYDLILDMGCFHSLSTEGKQRYIHIIYQSLAPGGSLLLYVFFRSAETLIGSGALETDIQAMEKYLVLIKRENGINQIGQRPSAWLIFSKR